MGIFDRLTKSKEVVEPSDNRKLVGRIIKLSDKGYGFISCKDIPFTRIFFHWTALSQDTRNFQDLQVGLNVEFEPLQLESPKGWRALRIRVIDSEE